MKALYIGIRGRVMRIDRATGRTLWETHLAGSQFVNVQVNGDELLATTRGEMYCLDPETGAILWRNGLPGMGWGIVTIAGDADNNAIAASHVILERQRAAANGGAAAAV